MSPVTSTGRLITIIYALIGIPLCLVVLASVGRLLTRAIKFVWMFVRRFYYTGSCRHVRRVIPASRIRMTLLQRLRRSVGRRTRPFRRAVRRRRDAAGRDDEEEEDASVEFEVDDEFDLPPAVAIAIGLAYALLGALLYASWEQWTYFEAFYFTVVSLSTIGFGDVVPDHPKFFIASSAYVIIGLALLAMIINVQMTAMHVTISKVTTRVIEAAEQRLTDDAKTDHGREEVAEPDVVVEDCRPQTHAAPPPPRRRSPSPMHRRRSV